MEQRFRWGHININVRDLDVSIRFYQKLGFEPFIFGIPYLDLTAEHENPVPPASAKALGIPAGTRGRACILQLESGFPKIDLTAFANLDQREPLHNKDRGLVRFCLISRDLVADYAQLNDAGVEFLCPPQSCHQRMAEIATCVDPDGTLIELLQLHRDRWPAIPAVNA